MSYREWRVLSLTFNYPITRLLNYQILYPGQSRLDHNENNILVIAGTTA